MNKRLKLSDQIRLAIDSSNVSRYAICKHIGLQQATMSRFMAGKGGLSLDKVDLLATLLRLELTNRPSTKSK